jgi:hypothetical protein
MNNEKDEQAYYMSIDLTKTQTVAQGDKISKDNH